jgi:AraC-like DNA-binding protein
MFTFEMGHCDTYRYSMNMIYTLKFHLLSLVVSGLDLFRYSGQTIEHPGPLIFLIPKGVLTTFVFSEPRLNYGIILMSRDIHRSRTPGSVDIQNHGTWNSLPIARSVRPEHVEEWQNKFEQIVEGYRHPTPFQTLRAERNILDAVLWLLDQTPAPAPGTPARQLKTLIEVDLAGRESIEELCARCHYSPDHLRLLFEKEFGISPKAYREQRRMSRAMELIVNTSLSAKEIAHQLGYTQASNFSSAFRSTIGISPREAIRSHRCTVNTTKSGHLTNERP